MVNLQTLNLSTNSFSCSIPASWSQLSNLKHLDLSNNNLTGSIPTQFFSIPTFNFSRTDLISGKSLNQPCSSSSRLPGGALLQLRDSLKDSSNHLRWTRDFVSPCFSWSYVPCRDQSVVALSLASNGFTGTLSPFITKLKFLLQNNSLSGTLPDYLGNMVNLQTLNLSTNSFSCSIPASWSQLSNLKHLDLSNNNLTGSIPTQFFSIPTFNHILQEEAKRHYFNRNLYCFRNSIPWSHGYVSSPSPPQNQERIFFDVAGEDDRKISFGQLKRFSLRKVQLAT
ncbi:hypothetical protein Bca52824_006420 [Brassica carinata]|uniref:Leucine-rich repeat-containing N-terminal plant-type domain-containing protein n=1 Tax=Brassica carinata TaxID=52824 RepID=A0A8X8B6Y8_BRACI|nr:hypothetical protein Bca52824_006420 [Brassica carinata]